MTATHYFDAGMYRDCSCGWRAAQGSWDKPSDLRKLWEKHVGAITQDGGRMTDRLQQKAAEIVREQLGYQVPASLESMRVDHPYEYKCALAGLTAGIAMAAEREKYLVEKIAAWADLLVDVRGERDKVLVLAEIMNSFVKASQGPAVAKGETQHG